MGTGLGENLGEIIPALKQPGIKNIDLQYNGIEKNYFTTYFKHMIDFENIIELNLSSNWFGIEGLFEVKDEFLKFKQLKSLSLAVSKLCMGAPHNV